MLWDTVINLLLFTGFFCLSLYLNRCFFAGISVVFQFPLLGIASFGAAAYSVRSATMERPTPDQVWMIGPWLPGGGIGSKCSPFSPLRSSRPYLQGQANDLPNPVKHEQLFPGEIMAFSEGVGPLRWDIATSIQFGLQGTLQDHWRGDLAGKRIEQLNR